MSVTHFVNLFMWAVFLFQMIKQSSCRPTLSNKLIYVQTENTLKLLLFSLEMIAQAGLELTV